MPSRLEGQRGCVTVQAVASLLSSFLITSPRPRTWHLPYNNRFVFLSPTFSSSFLLQTHKLTICPHVSSRLGLVVLSKPSCLTSGCIHSASALFPPPGTLALSRAWLHCRKLLPLPLLLSNHDVHLSS